MPRKSVESVRGKAYQELVDLIAKAQRTSGLSQAEVCRKLGKSRSYFGKIISGSRRLDIVEFFDLCRAMGVDPFSLLAAFDAQSGTNGSPTNQ